MSRNDSDATLAPMRNEQHNGLFNNVTPVEIRLAAPVLAVAIDTEEDFDWNSPTPGTSHSTAHLRNLLKVGGILSAYNIVPTYLLTYPVLLDDDVVRIVRYQVEKGRCALGIQLHPWVTPPFLGEGGVRASFLGNLPPGIEELKLRSCVDRFFSCFGIRPTVFRAGRYGLSKNTSDLLEQYGFLVDTSVAPRTSWFAEGGPDYTDYDCGLFRFGRDRQLLEIPLCRSVIGWGGGQSARLYKVFSKPFPAQLHAASTLTRSHFAERVTLSPEGNDTSAMRRLTNALLARGQNVFTLSFHSSSLQAGRNPYVRTKSDLHGFYDRLSEMLDYLVVARGFQTAELPRIPSLIDEASQTPKCSDRAFFA